MAVDSIHWHWYVKVKVISKDEGNTKKLHTATRYCTWLLVLAGSFKFNLQLPVLPGTGYNIGTGTVLRNQSEMVASSTTYLLPIKLSIAIVLY